ncbi:MAG: RDD family protein [Planctomycetes bacterium]|nr:RDD family protein [Planctomycetota bacterium]
MERRSNPAALVNSVERLDTAARVETPEGVELELRAAGPIPRSLAWSLDILLVLAIAVAYSAAMVQLGAAGHGLVLLGYFALSWGYDLLFEVLWGATPGKRAMGLRVVRTDGTPVTWVDSGLRNLLRFADLLPFGYGIGLACCMSNERFQRLGDLVAGTLVVHSGKSRTPRSRAQASAPFAPPFALTREEQRAVIDFAERAASIAPGRQIELAELLEPVLGAQGETARTRLLGLAAWSRGER